MCVKHLLQWQKKSLGFSLGLRCSRDLNLSLAGDLLATKMQITRLFFCCSLFPTSKVSDDPSKIAPTPFSRTVRNYCSVISTHHGKPDVKFPVPSKRSYSKEYLLSHPFFPSHWTISVMLWIRMEMYLENLAYFKKMEFLLSNPRCITDLI